MTAPLRRLAYCLWLLTTLTPWSTAYAAPSAAVSAGLTWLQAQVQTDGSLANEATSVATPLQARGETLTTLTTLGTAPAALGAAIAASIDESTESLARRTLALAATGGDSSSVIATLLARQNADGGFGGEDGYASDPLDTAWALLAFHGAGVSDPVAAAIGYLQSNQDTDGSYIAGDQQPDIYVTAYVVLALKPYASQYNLGTTLQAAVGYLQGQRTTGALWGNSVFLTAIAYLAVHDFVPLSPTGADINTLLTNAQGTDGSWGADDPYTTALAIRALALTTVAPQDQNVGAIQGQVTDASTGQPLAGVTVAITGATTQTLVTDATGRYLVTNVPTGAVTIAMSLGGYLSTQTTGIVATGHTLQFSPSLARNPQPVPITVRGLVEDATSNAPLSGADVTVLGTSYAGSSAADGSFSLSGIPPGSVQVEISLAGYGAATFSLSAPSGGAIDLGTILLTPGGSGSGATTGTVRGTITDALSGLPLQGVLVSTSGADAQATYTDATGHYVLDGLTPGAVTVVASLSGYQQAMGQGAVAAGTTLEFDAHLVAATNPALVTIQGKVVDATTDAPLSGVSVTVAGSSETTTSGTDGAFTLGNVPPGQPVSITLALAGYNSVTYTSNAAGGTLIALGTVKLSPTTPITSNQVPTISSTAPKQATAGAVYAYNVAASDPDGDTLTYGLATYPSGMTIDSTSGQIRWIPTASQVGTQTFTVVVYDTQGAQTQETATVTVDAGGSDAYVVTDVQTLSGLYVDAQVPANYVLGQYVSGGVPNFVSAANACPLGWFPGSGTVAAALGSLERLTGPVSLAASPQPGEDIIMDLGQPYSTVTVFPQIDHTPFPQEGIEYTVWGSDDPSATFPSGWHLATLVSIFRKGYTTSANCVGQTETDDYSGMYTFGASSYRYLRVRADYSITIFNTPAHQQWPSVDDDGGAPGWQSFDAEIDAVGGMSCSVKPTVDAGSPITGTTGQPIQFNGTGTQGNIVTYGWDINGDGVIDLTGPTPTYTFNTAVDRDVTLYAVDDHGCVGTGTVHVTIGLNVPKPDLTIPKFDTSAVATDPNTLTTTGSVKVTIANIGHAADLKPALVTVYEDTNGNGVYDSGIDNALGSMTMPSGLPVGGSLTMNIPITGTVSFPDSALSVMVDSNRQIAEEREDNNTAVSNTACRDATGGPLPDLVVGDLRVVGQAPAAIDARVGNAGLAASASTTIDFYEGDPTAGGLALGSQTVPALQPGAYQTVSLQGVGFTGNTDVYAVVNPGQTVAECDSANNTVHAPVDVPSLSADIGVATDASSYGSGADVKITATVSNQSSFDGTAQVRFTIETADGSATVATLPMPTPVSVPHGTSVPVTATWNTGTTLVGNYRVKAELLDASGTPYASAVAPFAIVSGQAATVTGAISTDKASYTPLDTVAVQDRITDVTANALAGGLTATTTVLNPDGSVRWTQSAAVPQLTPGGLQDLHYAVPLADAAPGTYRATLTVANATAPVAASNTTFTVQSSAQTGAGLAGTLQAAPNQVPLGEDLTLTAGVTNQGNAALAGLAATVTIVDPQSEQIVYQAPTTVGALAMNGNFQWVQNWTAAGTVGDTYVAVLSAQVGHQTLTLAQTNFVLLPPPIKLSVTQSVAARNRVLVLVDSGSYPTGEHETGHDKDGDGQSLDRVSILNTLLTNLNVTHRIVTDVPDFIRALRSGVYNDYWVLGGVDHWRDALSDELQEAVYRGDALLVDGSLHGWHNHPLYAVGGVTYDGQLWLSDQHITLAGLLLPAGTADTAGQALRLRVTTGTVQATFDGTHCLRVQGNQGDDQDKDSNDACQAVPYPAVVSNAYGHGHAMVLGFDLAGTLAETQDPAQWQALIKVLLAYLTPAAPANVPPFGYVSLDTTIQNEGIATNLAISQTLPNEAQYLDSEPAATVDPSGALNWTLPLAVGADPTITTGFAAPGTAGSYPVTTIVNTITNGTSTPYGTYSYDVTVNDTSALSTQLLADLNALAVTREDRERRDHAVEEIQQALSQATEGRYDDAINALAEAAENLIQIDQVDISASRLALDQLMQAYALQWYYTENPSEQHK